MTTLKMQAMAIIREVPDEKMSIIIEMLRGINNLVVESDTNSKSKRKATREEKRLACLALKGILAGHEVDLDKMREERILVN